MTISDDAFLFAEDKALKSLLQGITVTDVKNNTRPVKVWFGYPDVELRTQDYPYMAIDLYDIQEANDRQSSDSRKRQYPVNLVTRRIERPNHSKSALKIEKFC